DKGAATVSATSCLSPHLDADHTLRDPCSYYFCNKCSLVIYNVICSDIDQRKRSLAFSLYLYEKSKCMCIPFIKIFKCPTRP
ncbi:hypothetical protein C0J52_23201, partial [Blattella germanica]